MQDSNPCTHPPNLITAPTLAPQTLHKRVCYIALSCTLLSQATMAMYLPALPFISHQLGVQPTAMQMTLTLCLMGLGVSQLFYGPLTDYYGRKKILAVGLILFIIGCFLSVIYESFSGFMTARILQGFGAGCLLTLSRAFLCDVFSGRELARATSYLSMGFALGLGFSPALGGYLFQHFSWPIIFILQAVYAVILLISTLYLLPETQPQESRRCTQNFRLFFWKSLQHYSLITKNQGFQRYLVGGVLAYSVVIAYNVLSPFLLQNTVHISPHVYGYLALSIAIPYYFGAFANKSLVIKIGVQSAINIGLTCIAIGGISMLVCELILRRTDLLGMMIPMIVATLGQAMVFPNAIYGALKDFTANAGTASAWFSSLQMSLAALIAALLAFIPNHSSLPLAVMLISFAVLSGLLLMRGS